jgi:ion channel POLLUX/CASTOR
MVELMNPGTAPLLSTEAEILISPVVVSHVLAHVARRPDLSAIIDDLLKPGGVEIYFEPASRAGLVGETRSFSELQLAAMAQGVLCLGVRTKNGTIALNPPRARQWTFSGGEDLVYLSRPTS